MVRVPPHSGVSDAICSEKDSSGSGRQGCGGMGPLCCVDWACPVLGVGLSNAPSQTRGGCLGDINAMECCPTSGNVIC